MDDALLAGASAIAGPLFQNAIQILLIDVCRSQVLDPFAQQCGEALHVVIRKLLPSQQHHQLPSSHTVPIALLAQTDRPVAVGPALDRNLDSEQERPKTTMAGEASVGLDVDSHSKHPAPSMPFNSPRSAPERSTRRESSVLTSRSRCEPVSLSWTGLVPG